MSCFMHAVLMVALAALVAGAIASSSDKGHGGRDLLATTESAKMAPVNTTLYALAARASAMPRPPSLASKLNGTSAVALPTLAAVKAAARNATTVAAAQLSNSVSFKGFKGVNRTAPPSLQEIRAAQAATLSAFTASLQPSSRTLLGEASNPALAVLQDAKGNATAVLLSKVVVLQSAQRSATAALGNTAAGLRAAKRNATAAMLAKAAGLQAAKRNATAALLAKAAGRGLLAAKPAALQPVNASEVAALVAALDARAAMLRAAKRNATAALAGAMTQQLKALAAAKADVLRSAWHHANRTASALASAHAGRVLLERGGNETSHDKSLELHVDLEMVHEVEAEATAEGKAEATAEAKAEAKAHDDKDHSKLNATLLDRLESLKAEAKALRKAAKHNATLRADVEALLEARSALLKVAAEQRHGHAAPAKQRVQPETLPAPDHTVAAAGLAAATASAQAHAEAHAADLLQAAHGGASEDGRRRLQGLVPLGAALPRGGLVLPLPFKPLPNPFKAPGGKHHGHGGKRHRKPRGL